MCVSEVTEEEKLECMFGKTTEEMCSVKQIQRAEGEVASICKKISRVFDTICQKSNNEVQVQQVASR